MERVETYKYLDWQGTEDEDPAAVFPLVRSRTQPATALHLLGHVETLPEGHWAGRARARPVPHHGPFQQGPERSACRRGEGAEGQGI